MRSLSGKAVITHAIGRVLMSLLVIGGVVFMLFGEGSPVEGGVPTGWVAFAAVVGVILAIGYSVLWVKLFGYKLDDDEVRIERGVISKSYDSIPYARIQNVGIERSLLERILGISTVNIQTAGSTSHQMSAEGNIPGVGKQVAEQVREAIMDQSRGKEAGGGM